MKQYILKYQDFLNEALTKEESEKYKKIQVVRDVKALHSKIFGDTERIYIPFDFSHLEGLDKSKTQKRVEYILSKNGYEIVSYEQNQCKKVNDSRLTSIAKVLQSKNVNKPDLAVDYGQDVEKSRNLESVEDMYVCISRNSDDIASMSTDRDWTSCQNIRTGSERKYVAKDLKHGSIIAYLIKSNDREIIDPEARILIKPFINQEDSRDIVLLPSTVSYFRTKGKGNSKKEKYPNFYKFLMSWVNIVQPNISGTYQMQKDVYQDGDINFKFKNYKPEEMERIEDPQNQDDLKLAFDYYDLNFSKCKFNDNGLIEYQDNITISGNFRTLPKLFKFIETIEGIYLDLSNCPRLKSFKNLENLRRVNVIYIYHYNDKPVIDNIKGLDNFEFGVIANKKLNTMWLDSKFPKWREIVENPKSVEDFKILKTIVQELKHIDLSKLEMDTDGLFIYDESIVFNSERSEEIIELPKWISKFKKIKRLVCQHIGISDFKGLENLTEIGELDCDYSKIKSFKGLGNLKNIDYLSCAYTKNIENFEGLGQIQKIKILDCSYSSITSFKGLENLTDVDYLRCERIIPRNFEGLENIKYIRDFKVFNSKNIENFKELKNLKEIGGHLDCSATSITDFTGLENLTKIGSLDCSWTPITSFKGLEQCELNPDKLTPSNLQKKYIEWKETLKHY